MNEAIREQMLALKAAGIDLLSILDVFEQALAHDFDLLADMVFMDTEGYKAAAMALTNE